MKLNKRNEFFKMIVDMFNSNDKSKIENIDSIYLGDHMRYIISYKDDPRVELDYYSDSISIRDDFIESARYAFCLLFFITHPTVYRSKIYDDMRLDDESIDTIYDSITDKEDDEDYMIYYSLDTFLNRMKDIFLEDDHKKICHNDDYTLLWYNDDSYNGTFLLYIDPSYSYSNSELWEFVNNTLFGKAGGTVYILLNILDGLYEEDYNECTKYKDILDQMIRNDIKEYLDTKYNINIDPYIIFNTNYINTIKALVPKEKITIKEVRNYTIFTIYEEDRPFLAFDVLYISSCNDFKVIAESIKDLLKGE